jgi:hypothetical protein
MNTNDTTEPVLYAVAFQLRKETHREFDDIKRLDKYCHSLGLHR